MVDEAPVQLRSLDSFESPHVLVEINGEQKKLIIDTGAEVSLIKANCVYEEDIDEQNTIKFSGIGGKTRETLGKTEVEVKFIPFNGKSKPKNIKFQVIENNILGKYDGLIGNHFLREGGFSINYVNNTISGKFGEIPLRYLSEEDVIKGRSEVFRTVKVDGNLKREIVITRQEVADGIIVPNCVTLNENGECLVSIVNTTDKPCCLKNVRIIGENLSEFEFRENRSEIVSGNIRTDHLNKEEKRSLIEIVEKFSDIFSIEDEKLSMTSAVKHRIRTNPGAEPIFTKSYRYPKVHEEEVREQVQKLKKDGIIRDSSSPWSSPLWIVPKKTDASGKKKWRMVIDFRKLNDLTVADNYPLPNITEILDQLGKAKYFSTLDLTSGFHQIPMEEVDTEKTAFSTPYGHFEYTRMPFGLKNAPACFQRLMNTVLAGLQGIKCFVYLDDIVVYGQNLEEHNNKLIEVLEQLRKANLKLQPDKCEFLRKEVNYLGHVITDKGVKPDPKKIQSIVEMQAPVNTKGIKSFLGMIGYYRKFIRDFSRFAEPMTRLLKKDVEFIWGQEQQNSFQKLKELITKYPILQYPDFSKPFIITTDASNRGIGAVLSQEFNGKDLPIHFASRTLNKSETSYSTTEKECLAIVWATKQFRPYIYGTKFVIMTDHRPLTWLFQVKDPGSRLVRWRLKLEEFDYTIVYKKGKENVVADELSRNVRITEQEKEETWQDLLSLLEEEGIEVNKENEENPNNIELHVDEENSGENNENILVDDPTTESEKFCEVEAGQTTDKEEVNDPNRRQEILREYHNGLLGGHTGQKATYAKMSGKFKWKGMQKHVEEFIRNCPQCQTEKVNRAPTRNPMKVITSADRALEKIMIDMIGPMKETEEGYRFGLTIQDDLSKFIKFIPLKSKEMKTVANTLLEQWVMNYGMPKIILSDNGAEFCNSLFKELCEILNIKHITTSVAYPQANGSVERAHCRLLEYLKSTEKELENSTDWHTRMPYAGFCYNNTKHATTGYTPYEIVFGFEANKPSGVDPYNEKSMFDYIDELKAKLYQTQENVKANTKRCRQKSKIRYDKKIGRHINYKAGEQVLIRNDRRGKFESQYRGPFTILEVYNDYLIIKLQNKKQKVNKANLKPYFPGSRS